MAEPIRKREKAHGGAGPTSDVLLRRENPSHQNNPLIFLTTHETKPHLFDLTEFAEGANGPRRALNQWHWKGNFRGRRELIHELAPSIRLLHGSSSTSTGRRVEGALRELWRLLDLCDALPGIEPLRSVRDFTEMHEAMQMRHRCDGEKAEAFIRIVNAARASLGLHRLSWTASSRAGPAPCKDGLGLRQTGAIYTVLKNRVRRLYAEWDSNPSAVPSKSDARNVLYFQLVKTGWNEGTALAIDIDDFVRPHPTDPQRELLHAIKARGDTEQIAHSMCKSEWSPANLVRKMIERTLPLRRTLRVRLETLQGEIGAQCHLWDEKTVARKKLEAANLRNSIRSPWLHVAKPFSASAAEYTPEDSGWAIAALSIQDTGRRPGSGPNAGKTALDLLIEEANVLLKPEEKIQRITLSDLRDAFIGFSYERHGYQWLVAKLAAGHSSIKAAISYLRKHRYKQRDEGMVRRLGNGLFDEIRTYRIVDPAILFALVQRGVVTPEQRARWLAGKDRTYVGMGCLDYRNPPKSISPDHVQGNGCRVHRCSLCEHAVAFEDSVDGLARKRAELAYLRESMPLPAWLASSFVDEFERTDGYLVRFDAQTVRVRVGFWAKEIAEGRHVPLQFEGDHG